MLAGVLAWLGAVLLLTAAGDPARAQATGAINPGERPEPAAKDEPPPGGCMPIGVTASGEVVFPFLCKGFIEQHKSADQKPAAAEEGQKPAAAEQRRAAETDKPAKAETSADDKSAAKQSEADSSTTATITAAPEPAAPAPSPEPIKPREGRTGPPAREGRAGPPGCTRFRSYDASSGTYVDYSGRRQACRS